eukprot:4296470-Pleurochrysis_carterae.AAC.1
MRRVGLVPASLLRLPHLQAVAEPLRTMILRASFPGMSSRLFLTHPASALPHLSAHVATSLQRTTRLVQPAFVLHASHVWWRTRQTWRRRTRRSTPNE